MLHRGLARELSIGLERAGALDGQVIDMDECRERLSAAGSRDFYFVSLDGNLVLDAGEPRALAALVGA